MNNNPVEKRSVGRTIADVILYLAVFAAAQFVFVSLTSLVAGLVGGSSLSASQSQGLRRAMSSLWVLYWPVPSRFVCL